MTERLSLASSWFQAVRRRQASSYLWTDSPPPAHPVFSSKTRCASAAWLMVNSSCFCRSLYMRENRSSWEGVSCFDRSGGGPLMSVKMRSSSSGSSGLRPTRTSSCSSSRSLATSQLSSAKRKAHAKCSFTSTATQSVVVAMMHSACHQYFVVFWKCSRFSLAVAVPPLPS